MGVIALVDALDTFHEFGEGLELGPLVVDRFDRPVHVD
jgi:hypothetical protein